MAKAKQAAKPRRKDNRKAELLTEPVEHIDVKSFDAPIVEAWSTMSSTSRDASRAAEILNMALADKTCSIWLTHAGSTSAGGWMHVWRGGAVSELDVKMRVNAVAALARGEEIAAVLTAEGHRSPNCSETVLPITVQRLRLGAGFKKMIKQRTRWRHDRAPLNAPELAGELNTPVKLAVQIQRGPILIDRQPSGAFAFENKSAVIEPFGNCAIALRKISI